MDVINDTMKILMAEEERIKVHVKSWGRNLRQLGLTWGEQSFILKNRYFFDYRVEKGQIKN
jgi:transposase